PTVYHGEEIGMRDVAIPPNEVRDPQGLNMPDRDLSRDPCRTPMQWDSTPNAGFSDTRPWLRVSHNYARLNVEVQKLDAFSMLNFYKNLIDLRRREPALNIGTYRSVLSNKQLIAFTREHEGTRFLIVLNMSHRPCFYKGENIRFMGQIELSTEPENNGKEVADIIGLSGDEGVIVRLKRGPGES
ncbi:MAG: DUF3459 domain-containing protein, partial [Bacteroidota bacterium]|nr:DUF3459 domain-containing protein [Bacteroidota bacterium]